MATRTPLYLALVLLSASLQEAVCQLNSGQTSFDFFSGQGTPPPGFTVQNLTVHITLTLTRLLQVDEQRDVFTAAVGMHMFYFDPRAYDLAMAPYESCKLYCSSQSSDAVNGEGQPACCDNVYIPSAECRNVNSYSGQTVPYIYRINPLPNGVVEFLSQFVGTFNYKFDYSSYPWDTHYLAIDVKTSYLPLVSGSPLEGSNYLFHGGTVIASQKKGPSFEPGSPRALTPVVSAPGWKLGQIWMDVLNVTEQLDRLPAIEGHGRLTFATGWGFRVYIQVFRVSRIYYATIVMLPTALIIVFSFVVFSLGRRQFKARIGVLLLLFLSLILLQFVLGSILPGTYSLLSPVYLILVSYIYNLLLLLSSILSYAIYTHHLRGRKAQGRGSSKDAYQRWAAALRRSVSRPVEPTPEAVEEEQTLVAERGSGLRLRKQGAAAGEVAGEGLRANRAVDDIDEQTQAWFSEIQQRRFVRSFPFVRDAVIWSRFVSQENSREYLDSLSHQFESWMRLILLVAYLVSIGLISGFARNRADMAASANVVGV